MDNPPVETAGRLKCPNCAALVAPGHAHCEYCGVALATRTCPACMRTVFVGFEHCPECGAEVVGAGPLAEASCPICKQAMSELALGEVAARQCGNCLGLWLEHAAFDRIRNREDQRVAALGVPGVAPENQLRRTLPEVHYRPCPGCGKLMNRINFARCSGVIVDTCKLHGIWFDRDELHQIVEFIEAGGLGRARDRDAERMADERRRLEMQQRIDDARPVGKPAVSTRAFNLDLGSIGDEVDISSLLSGIGRGIRRLF